VVGLRTLLKACLLVATLLAAGTVLTGCNFWSGLGMHKDGDVTETNSHVLTADGQASLRRGDYLNAMNTFQRAVDLDPVNSEARVGLAEAALKDRGFNLINFISKLVKNSNQGSGLTADKLITPADWKYTTNDECAQFFASMINVLDPIALGHTSGPYRSTDVTLNLNVGFFYVLHMAALVQKITVAYQIQQISKSSTSASALGLDQATFNLLPDSFYWVTQNGVPMNSLQTLQDFQQIQNDVDHGLQRLRTAAANTSSHKLIDDIIKMFSSLQTQAHE
jgi:predicted small secreted protein